ncbi:MAG: radical SAM protein [Muribaculaceae bacterium]
MKSSYYNYILYKNGYGYWFNARTINFFRLSESTSKKLEWYLDEPDLIKQISDSLYKKLYDSGFIIPDDTKELDIIRTNHLNAKNCKDYFLVILPTLNCNFNCWYCIQDHIPSIMNEVVLESIKNHIDYMIEIEKISSLHLSWFGGEPFMFYKQVVKPISEYALNKCDRFGIPFKNSATTNGYFIDNEVSKDFEYLRFKQFQITLDGDRSNHDKVKYIAGCESAFDKVLSNINNILQNNKEIIIGLRINYTHNNLSENIVHQVCKFINQKFRERVLIIPKKVWQEKPDKTFQGKLDDILDLFHLKGFNVNYFDINSNFLPCYVNRAYYNAINYNGHVIKCTACDDMYKKEPYGLLMEDGTIKWLKNFDKKCLQPTFENPRCLECKKLPVCMGLCPRDFMSGANFCKYDCLDTNFEDSLLRFLIYKF